ncbi:MAG: phage antirepressor N-terminal domain-containing protein [Mangrovibacterium sp.]
MNGEKRVAIKPICQAFGIDIDSQRKKLKNDFILSSVVKLSLTTGSDGKQHEMVTIPFRYVFGWLFRIDSRNVKLSIQPRPHRRGFFMPVAVISCH